ncbi:uncharacterized protein LOC144120309 [Amblyomma americanum]
MTSIPISPCDEEDETVAPTTISRRSTILVTSYKASRRPRPRCCTLSVLFAVGVVPGFAAITVMCFVFRCGAPGRGESRDADATSVVYTHAPRPTTPIQSTATPGQGTACTTDDCQFMAQWLLAKVNPSIDPCDDFYGFVCGSFQGSATSALKDMKDAIIWKSISSAHAALVPATGQTAWQKAAALFQACVALKRSSRSETVRVLLSGCDALGEAARTSVYSCIGSRRTTEGIFAADGEGKE